MLAEALVEGAGAGAGALLDEPPPLLFEGAWDVAGAGELDELEDGGCPSWPPVSVKIE